MIEQHFQFRSEMFQEGISKDIGSDVSLRGYSAFRRGNRLTKRNGFNSCASVCRHFPAVQRTANRVFLNSVLSSGLQFPDFGIRRAWSFCADL